LSDRIAVMYAGQIIDIVDATGATRESIGLLMAGVRDQTEQPVNQPPRHEKES
jgi:simple sugar transport system ATP-binding protein